MLWLIGSCNYLWGTTILLLFLLPFRLQFDSNKSSNSIFKIVYMFLFGILAGWTNENNAAALLTLIVLFACYRLFNKQKLQAWNYSGFIGALIGFLMMILSPGNRIRSSRFANNHSFLWNLYHRFIDYTDNFIDYLLPALII